MRLSTFCGLRRDQEQVRYATVHFLTVHYKMAQKTEQVFENVTNAEN
jgi:hypothetical protein